MAAYPELSVVALPAGQQIGVSASGLTLAKLLSAKKRNPKLVVDVGAGAGAVSLMLSDMGFEVIAYEPCAAAEKLLAETAAKTGLSPERVRLVSTLPGTDLSRVDTTIFCSSIEHIYPEDFNQTVALLLPPLRRNRGRLIIVNSVDNHPIGPDGIDHVRLIDDAFFDELPRQLGGQVRHREDSHLIVDF